MLDALLGEDAAGFAGEILGDLKLVGFCLFRDVNRRRQAELLAQGFAFECKAFPIGVEVFPYLAIREFLLLRHLRSFTGR